MSIKFILLIFTGFVFVSAGAQTVDFSFSTSNGLFCNPQTVNFTASASGTPTGYVWNFGNGQSASTPTASITYAGPGTYTVTLTAIYTNSAVTSSKSVLINPTPAISLSADRNNLCQPGNILFTATGSNFITVYEWNFGDGSPVLTTNTNSISHSFSTYNSFTVSVKGTTANNCSASATYNVSISKFLISGAVSPTNGCIPMNSLLSATAFLPAGDAPQNYVWDFGDGTPLVSNSNSSMNHLYNTTANITTASVTITSAQGCTNQYIFPAFAYGTPPVGMTATTVNNRDTFCGSETIQFTGIATNANAYLWEFGDGNTATVTGTGVSHKYKTLGNKRVIVTPYFNGCAGAKDTLNIYITGVIADFNFSNTCGNKNVYAFTNLSQGNVDHFEWLFSDSPFIDSTNYNVSHTFPPTGVFTAKLLLIDSITGCRDSLAANIITARPSLISTARPVCKDSLIVYTVLNSYPPGNGYTYEFHVNGLVIDNGTTPALNFNPVAFGIFTEFVVIKDTYTGTCNDTIYLSGTTKVRGPVVDFDAALRLCADSSVIITNRSYPAFSGETITRWSWDFGDNKKDSIQNPPPHRYPAGFYTLSLTATDINGCRQRFSLPITIDPLPNLSVFPAIDTLCLRDTAILTAYSVDAITWTPTTNINCIDCDTVKVYPSVTTAYIAKATNIFGCTGYDTSLVKLFGPINLQVSPPDTTVCPGNPIPFKLNSPGITVWSPPTYLNNARIQNPVSRPDTAITYTVIVRDSVGCFADTATAIVRVHPKPTVNAGPDKILPYYTSYTMMPAYSNDVVNYKWTPAGNLSCTNCPTPEGIAVQKEIYQIEVANNFGCKARDTIVVLVNCLQSNLLMPTAFTPNQDGKNDMFYPITRGYRIIKSFLIYNRLGNKVFERQNFNPNIPSLGWDGNIRGYSYGTTEAFAWMMEAECDAGQVVNTKGTVVMIR